MEITHEQLVKNLKKDPCHIEQDLTYIDCDLIHMIFGICGEAGELLDAVKKAVIYRQKLDCDNVIEELGDIEFYLEGFRQAFGVSRETCLKANIAKLTKRYENGYSDKAAKDRVDKSSTEQPMLLPD